MIAVTLEQAQEVHARMLVVDGHNDTPVERIHRGEKPIAWETRDPAYHMDIPRMKEGGFHAGFFIVGNGPTANVRVTIEQTLTSIEKNPNDLLLIHRSKDVETAQQTGRIGILMAIEGAGLWLEGEIDVLGLYHRLGVRCIGITHGEGGDDRTYLQKSKSPFGPCTPADREFQRKHADGLTPFGKEVLRESNRRGIITDLAHINDKAFYEVIETTLLPVTMTHTAAFAQCNHYRCLTDDQIRVLADVDGVMGIAFVPSFIDAKNPSIDRLVEHICYVADLVGIEHVAIGSDYDGMGNIVPIIPEVSQLVHLTRSMLAHGLSESDIQKVWGGNFMRLFQQTMDMKTR
jgi:membrane dipeptidase